MKKQKTQESIAANRARWWRAVFCAIIIPAILHAIFLQINNVQLNNFFWFGIFPVAAGWLTVYIVSNLILYIMLKNRDFNVARFRAKVFEQKDKLLTGLNKYHAKNTFLAVLVQLYLWSFVFIIIIINIAAMTDLFQFLWTGEFGNFVFFALSALAVFIDTIFLGHFFRTNEESIDSIHMYLSRYEYPQIWDTAIAAKIQIGVKGDLAIIVAPGANVGITLHSKRHILLIGFDVLSLLNRAELYAVFLHEFGHAVDKRNRISSKRQKLSAKLEYLSTRNKLHPAFLFIPISALFAKNLYVFSLLTSYKSEQNADKIITKQDDILSFINAVAKLDLYNLWLYELPKQNLYYSETPPQDYFEIRFQAFKAAYLARKQKWDSICLNQLEARIDTHPNLPQRMKVFGIHEFNVDFTKDPEISKDIAKIESKFWPHIMEDWDKVRKSEYLQHKETVLRWQDAETIPSQCYAELANAYFALCDYDCALKYYDKVLADNPSNAQAIYRKGLILCDRYDDTGIDLLYQLISNPNHGDMAFLRLGMYLQYMGLADKRIEIREEMYSRIDQNIEAKISKKFKIKPSTLTPEVFNRILNIVKTEEKIFSAAYLASKEINNKDNNSLFLCLYQGVDENAAITSLQKIEAAISTSSKDITVYVFRDFSQIGKLSKKLSAYNLLNSYAK